MNLKISLFGVMFFGVKAFAAETSRFDLDLAPGTSFYSTNVILKPNFKTKMLVDTGASDTVIAEWFSQENKFEVSKTKEQGKDSGGVGFELNKTRLAGMTVGGQFFKNEYFFIVPTPRQFKDINFGGILSPQKLFNGSDFVLDFPKNQMVSGTRLAAEMSKRKLVERLNLKPCSKDATNKYLVKALLNGNEAWLYLDTGGRRSAISQSFSKKLGDLQGTQSERAGVASIRSVVTVKGMEIVLGGTHLTAAIDIEPKGVSCSGADGKLGIDILRNYALLFNAERSSVSLYD